HELTEAYEGELRGQDFELLLPVQEASLCASDPKFEAVKRKLFSGRANNAIALAYMQPGDRLLELGCGDGTTLASQNDALGVATYGVELSSLRMEQARSHGVRVELT